MKVWKLDIIARKFSNKARHCFFNEAILVTLTAKTGHRLLLGKFNLQFDDVD
jgi:hypothetical protein